MAVIFIVKESILGEMVDFLRAKYKSLNIWLSSSLQMAKIGMKNTQQDFNHPKLDQGHRLERHCLYAITQQQWLAIVNKPD